MRHSEQINELVTALVAFQHEMPQVKKENTAEVVSKRTGGKFQYKYADLADVYNAAMPVSSKHGLAIFQGIVEGKLQTRLAHTSGQWTEDDGVPLPMELNPQELGGAITYFRRYGALCALGIAPEEDDDAGKANYAHNQRQQVQPIRSNVHNQLQQSVNQDADDDELAFLNDDRPPQEVAVMPKNPANKPFEGAISAGQVKRLWAIAKQSNRDKDFVLRIVGNMGFESVENIHWKKYNEVIEKIQGA